MNRSPAVAVGGAADADPSRRATAVTLRRVAFVLASLTLLGIGWVVTDSPDVVALLPFFFFAVTLQFIPLFWPEDADALSPPALACLLYGTELLGEAIGTVASGTLRFPYLEDLPHSVRLELVQKALAVCIIASAGYLAGYYLGAGRRRIARVFPRVSGLSWNRNRLALVSAACVGAFLFTYTFFQNRMDADLTDITALAEGKAVWRDDPSMTWLGRGILLGFIPLLLWVATVAEKLTVRRAITVAIPCVIMALLATRLGQRGYGLMFALSVMIIIHNVYKPFRLTVLTGMAVAAMISVQVMGEWRQGEAAPGEVRPSIASRITNPERVLSTYATDRNRIPVIATVMYYIPDRQDYLLGASFAALIAAPVPKWIWPGKQDFFMWRDSAIVGNLHGIPAPVPLQGVLYANFSWGGCVIGMFLWGLFQRGLYEWLLEDRKDKNRALLYATLVLYFAPSSLALANTLQYVVPIWVIIKFVGRRAKQPTPALAAPQPVTAEAA